MLKCHKENSLLLCVYTDWSSKLYKDRDWIRSKNIAAQKIEIRSKNLKI